MSEYPWDESTATGVGSHPGEDHAEAVRVVFGEVPALPYLPELPARGVGADMIGRTASLLVELPVEVQPSGWRFADRPGRDSKRARDHLLRDLDTLEETAQGHEGPFKIQVAGPWTLAGAIELRYGDKTLADPGAVMWAVQVRCRVGERGPWPPSSGGDRPGYGWTSVCPPAPTAEACLCPR